MKTIVIIILTFTLLSCKPTSESASTNPESEITITEMVTSNDTIAMIGVVKSFLKWYKINYEKANNFGFTYQDKRGNYQVSVAQGEEFLIFLKGSGYISDKYVELWLQYFKDKAQYLEDNLQNEGPPEGFEFDLVLITQEPEEILNTIDSLQFVMGKNNGSKAILQIVGDYGYDIEMIKENGKWMIEYIATMNYD